MEDENRDLPDGWVRQYDPKTHHQFFVDKTHTPEPRSIWHHPYDDDTYLNSLSESERERIKSLHRVPSRADIEAESSDDDNNRPDLPKRQEGEAPVHGVHKFGRKMKDKLTNSTHSERALKREQREEAERRAYAQHQHFRQQMTRAAETGIPQLLGKDKDGKDVYIEPPGGPGGVRGNAYGGGYGGYGNDAYGYNPYQQGPYTNPNARFMRPSMEYSRPYGYGYGGGYGLPLLGGLTGALLLGGLLW